MRRQAHQLTAETRCIVQIQLQCAWILQCITVVYMLQRTVYCVIAQLITTASEALSQYMYYNIIYNLSDSCLHSTMDTSQITDVPLNLWGRVGFLKYIFAILIWKYVRTVIYALAFVNIFQIVIIEKPLHC